MVTKERKIKKYCCFYVSDFHLEMILLPYIKNHIEESKIIIFTQKNLSESIKLLLNKTNFNLEEKEKILKLNWDNKKIEKIDNKKIENYEIIINGNLDYISKINKEIEKLNLKNLRIIDCYNIEQKDLKVANIQEKYDDILNTKNS